VFLESACECGQYQKAALVTGVRQELKKRREEPSRWVFGEGSWASLCLFGEGGKDGKDTREGRGAPGCGRGGAV